MEVIHLSEFLKQNTQKYTEDIKKLEEKVRTSNSSSRPFLKVCGSKMFESCQILGLIH